MRRNDRSNRLIMWLVVVGDFVLLNALIYASGEQMATMASWSWERMRTFVLVSNIALLISEWKFHTTIHERLVSAGDVLKSIVLLTITQMALAYMMMRHVIYQTGVGWILLEIGTVFFVLTVILRLMERNAIKRLRRLGRNTRTVTMVGSDKELREVYKHLLQDPTTGYRVKGYYADEELIYGGIPWLGTVKGLVEDIKNGKDVSFGDDLFVCLSRREGDSIRLLAQHCDSQVTRFYYVPVSVESIQLNLEREYVNDIEIFTTHESPLEIPMNQAVKRAFDIVLSVVALILTGLMLPLIYFIIKIQSPGPILFRQQRTGMNGRDFQLVKFRSMHVNKDADKLQATKDDPRKYPFGNFMRKMNIDELPQFWNVLKGDMSVVGPRPHMLAHTEQYSKAISSYMVRHFVKPGITGWAQVTGFRGETKELWQMEERVKRDIWYMEHWSIWLDIRIAWLTIKKMFIHDKYAY